jgi:hypothetical protein
MRRRLVMGVDFPEGARVRIGRTEGTVKGVEQRVVVQFDGVAGPGYFNPKFVHLVNPDQAVSDAVASARLSGVDLPASHVEVLGEVARGERDPGEAVRSIVGDDVVPPGAWVDIVGAVGWDESNRCWPKLVAAVENAARQAIEQHQRSAPVPDGALRDQIANVIAAEDLMMEVRAQREPDYDGPTARADAVMAIVGPVLAAKDAEIEKLNLEIQGHQVSDG